ncbi:transcriptional regulator [Solibacillus sp. FSL H8-0538]|uniref:transcriptional regulator n=1 Tax=Solibacillus sp. FSL H8-0538 TaxID=2921400 RepID=UPI0030F72915
MEHKRRKDQWTVADDEKLAEIVIQAVQNGKTQLEAFEAAALVLNRTKQACGFRWNKTLRLQYGQMLNSVRKRPKQLMRSHLKLALTSFDELTEAYTELELKYRELQTDHEKLLRWLQQGNAFLSKQQEAKEEMSIK